jgi:hypothetical protein
VPQQDVPHTLLVGQHVPERHVWSLAQQVDPQT